MELTRLGIEGVWLAESPVWSDERGFFREWFESNAIFEQTGINFQVAQANTSISKQGTVRGIHYSVAKQGQAKLVTCVMGAIQDVIVDIRPKSKTFGTWIDYQLDSKSGKSLVISGDLGHGFLALQTDSVVTYLLSSRYSPEEEHCINPFDPEIGINWRNTNTPFHISEKDESATSLRQKFAEGHLPYQTLT
jgi:dTDP-4-dehydrorhamnose 3,5-epimerase